MLCCPKTSTYFYTTVSTGSLSIRSTLIIAASSASRTRSCFLGDTSLNLRLDRLLNSLLTDRYCIHVFSLSKKCWPWIDLLVQYQVIRERQYPYDLLLPPCPTISHGHDHSKFQLYICCQGFLAEGREILQKSPWSTNPTSATGELGIVFESAKVWIA